MRKWFLGLGSLVLATAMAWAAGPMPDTFFVHFNDPVVVSSSLTLQPGNYKFQRMTNPTDPAVFTIINAAFKDARYVVAGLLLAFLFLLAGFLVLVVMLMIVLVL